MATFVQRRSGRGRSPGMVSRQADVPYAMRLPDGRTVYVEVPGQWVARDRGGETAFLPPAVRLLDRVRALAMPLNSDRRAPSPGFITCLRQALRLTQRQLGERVGVDKMTVSRWERGVARPSRESLVRLERVRREAVRRGVAIPA